MTRFRPVLAAILAGLVAALALLLAGCEGESQQDLPQSKVKQVEPSDAESFHSPDRFPNVVTYCVHGHRVILNTRDQGANMAVIPNDPSCAR